MTCKHANCGCEADHVQDDYAGYCSAYCSQTPERNKPESSCKCGHEGCKPESPKTPH